ncbi:MAG: T9SS C-terminal target domain-containing protein, partial [Bacteroidetes bacterium]
GQVLFEENFEGGNTIPAGWTVQSNATDGGWLVGSTASLSSQYFTIASNGSSGVAGTNDDACNCDKSNEYLITPAIDLSDQTVAILKFDAFFTDDTYQGNDEDVTIEVSTDGVNWVVLEDLHGHDSWDTHIVNLTDYAGEETLYVGFRYDDGGGWLYGFAIDNVIIEVPPVLEVALVEIQSRSFGEVNSSIPLKGLLFNGGATEINSFEVGYAVDGINAGTEAIEGVQIEPFHYHAFELASPWTPESEGIFEISINITSVNGQTDENTEDNSDSFDAEIFEVVVVPDKIEAFLNSEPVVSEVTGASAYLDKPTDLDFFPILGKDELWVVNQRTENEGGSTLTIADATSGAPSDFWERVDGNAWHFMSLPTGIAFSPENFNFGTSPGVKDANHDGGTFTGPTLWSSDPEIYAQPSGGNGSHLDMLHGSPFSMGIAHEIDNVFWVYDDWNKDIVRYDFVEDHGPGNDYHGDATVRRYGNMGIDADGNVPNHMILDKATGWLYFVDNGNDRVVRMDINTGSGSSIPEINEPLAEHSSMSGFNYELVIDTGLDKPCGIEIFENRLLVGDYATGDIIIYDMDNDFVELGRVPTGAFGLTGIKVGPDGNIWCVNREQEKLMVVEPGETTGTNDLENALQITVSPNPTSGQLGVDIPQLDPTQELKISLVDVNGRKILDGTFFSNKIFLDLEGFPAGIYQLNIQTLDYFSSEKIILNK